MKVHLIKAKTIYEYARVHASSRRSFRSWLAKINNADWEKPEDIKRTFARVDFLGQGSKRVVFNIGGNNYRIICSYHFGKNRVHLFVKWIGTHAEYDKICDQNLHYTVERY